MQSLNLRGDPPVSDEPAASPPEEPLGLESIRTWLRKPRPRLYRLWLWVPHLAAKLRKAAVWCRVHGPPAMRRAAAHARKAAKILEALRRVSARLANWFRTTFPPGSRGHEFAAQLAAANRGFGRAILALLGIGREMDRLPELLPREEGRAEPARPRQPAAEPDRRPEEPAPEPARSPPLEGEALEDTAPPGRTLPRAPAVRPPRPPRDKPPAADAPRTRKPAGAPPPADPMAGPREAALAGLSNGLRAHILTLGARPRRMMLRYTIWRVVNECGATTSEKLGLLPNVDAGNLTTRHLGPMVDDGVLERTVPDRITHPDQAYRATGKVPG